MTTWFITGASSGLGAALARAVLGHGDNAAITASNTGPAIVQDAETLSHRSCSSSAATRSTGSAPPLTTPPETPAGSNSSAAAPTQHREQQVFFVLGVLITDDDVEPHAHGVPEPAQSLEVRHAAAQLDAR
jgi:NAD(P)-dependent dehydrogenase (short-subunit alcohol dehydrogenase family)